MLYTVLTQGRIENHVHVVLTADGEEHTLPSPTLDLATTATELLEGTLARDGTAISGTTTQACKHREPRDAVAGLGHAVCRRCCAGGLEGGTSPQRDRA